MKARWCPDCRKLGHYSKMSSTGKFRQKAPVESFYDEDGDWHWHDETPTIHYFACERGCNSTEKRYDYCAVPGCSWGDPEDE